MAWTLALIPLLLVVGLGALAWAPTVTILLSMQIVRRVGNYAVTRPAREMLFTEVSEEERFKAKPVIDVVVYRGGDAMSASLFAVLTDGLGLGLAAVSLIGAGMAALWAGTGVHLGRRYGRRQTRNQWPGPPPQPATLTFESSRARRPWRGRRSTSKSRPRTRF